MKEELMDDVKRFMDKTRGYDNFRAGGNLGRIVQGNLQKEGLDNLVAAINKLADTLKAKD